MSYTIQELKHVCLFPSRGIQEYPTEDMDEVYPGIYVGNARAAGDLERLRSHDVGYVLNASHGADPSLNLTEVHPRDVYERAGLEYCGIGAIDMSSYPLKDHFEEATDFIRRAVRSGQGVLVHCKQGISRSAALVIAYLMSEEGMDVKEALRLVRSRREIFPNDGFLQQLSLFKPQRRRRDCASTP